MKNFIPQISKKISKEVYLDGSKSIANRVQIIAAMADGVSVIKNLPNSADILACVGALKELGFELEHSQTDKTLKIKGLAGEFPKKSAKIFCNESGTLTRFITPMCAVQAKGEYYLYAAERMMERPMQDQLVVLEKLGMSANYERNEHSLPMTINAKTLIGQNAEVDGKKSSQFASGLLMAGAYMQNGLKMLSISNHKQPYLEMTAKVMQEFGVDVAIDGNTYTVNKSIYKAQPDYTIEPDASTASYFFAVAAITGSRVKVMNITRNSKQGDVKFVEVLEKMGCVVNYFDDGIEVIGTDNLKGVTVDMRNFSDTFMTLSAVACFADGDTHISGLTHTRGQESDRVSAMEEGLTKLGMCVETTEDTITISPSRSSFNQAEVYSHNDHRIAMSLALLGLKNDGVLVDGAEAVSKTCPDYFERMRDLIA